MSPHHQSLKFISRYLSSFSFLVIFAFGSDWPTLIAVVVNDHAFLLNAHLDAVEPKSETVNANFSANFEGRKGRAVTESTRKRIPELCSSEAKRTINHAVWFCRWVCKILCHLKKNV